MWVVGQNPGDFHADINNYKGLCRVLGLSIVPCHNPNRRRKPGPPIASVRFEYFPIPEKPGAKDLLAMYPKLPSLRPPKRCNTAMWKESLPCTPLVAIMKHLVRLVDGIKFERSKAP